MKTLDDTDPMPIGKAHRGKPMSEVPASYFHWLWTNGLKEDVSSPVHDYVKRNLDALKKEWPDGIWS